MRTTAYTHTESDHREYGNHNALGGELQAAGPPIHRAEVTRRAIPVGDAPRAVSVDETGSYSPQLQPFSMEERRTVTRTTKRGTKTARSVKRAVVVAKPRVGSAAADWSRWPAGTAIPTGFPPDKFIASTITAGRSLAATRLIYTCRINVK